MTVPGFQDILLPLLQLAAERASLRLSDAVDQLAGRLGLSEADRHEMLGSGGQTRFANRVYWAKFYLSKTSLVETRSKGIIEATANGRAELAHDPSRIDLRYLGQRFPDIMASIRSKSVVTGDISPTAAASAVDESASPRERVSVLHRQIDGQLEDDLLDRVLAEKPAFFERVVRDLASAMGYGGGREDAVRVVGRSGDGGVDVEIDQDPLGAEKLYLQAKRYQPGQNISDAAIRDFAGALRLRNAIKGVVVTTSSFTASARASAERLGIVLINGEQLAALMIRYGVGVRVEETFYIKRIDEDFFLE